MAHLISGIIATMATFHANNQTTTTIYNPSIFTSSTTIANLTNSSNLTNDHGSPFGTFFYKYVATICCAISIFAFIIGSLNGSFNARIALAHEYRDGTAEERLARVEESCQHWLGKKKGGLETEEKKALKIEMLDLEAGREDEGLLADSTCADCCECVRIGLLMIWCAEAGEGDSSELVHWV
ncbi:hypothetical protein IFR05_009540 [Cadophora sp. M221]|nr:hypothetical protein IFR05_009540 [Cadophora sp. M221]